MHVVACDVILSTCMCMCMCTVYAYTYPHLSWWHWDIYVLNLHIWCVCKFYCINCNGSGFCPGDQSDSSTLPCHGCRCLAVDSSTSPRWYNWVPWFPSQDCNVVFLHLVTLSQFLRSALLYCSHFLAFAITNGLLQKKNSLKQPYRSLTTHRPLEPLCWLIAR